MRDEIYAEARRSMSDAEYDAWLLRMRPTVEEVTQ